MPNQAGERIIEHSAQPTPESVPTSNDPAAMAATLARTRKLGRSLRRTAPGGTGSTVGYRADQPPFLCRTELLFPRVDRVAADTEEVLASLLEAADLPPVAFVGLVDENAYGLDNRLIKATLEDGREVLLRQSTVVQHSPRRRVDFLRQTGSRCPFCMPQMTAAMRSGSSCPPAEPDALGSKILETSPVDGRPYGEPTGPAGWTVGAIFSPNDRG